MSKLLELTGGLLFAVSASFLNSEGWLWLLMAGAGVLLGLFLGAIGFRLDERDELEEWDE